MLLGINAHINGNLTRALTDLNYTHQRDFSLVNDILQEVFPEVMHFMVFSEHDIFSTGGVVFKKFFLSEFHNAIEKWRSEAWVNARYMIHDISRKRKKEVSYEALSEKTEQIGLKLVHDFETLTVLPTLPELINHMMGPSLYTQRKVRGDSRLVL